VLSEKAFCAEAGPGIPEATKNAVAISTPDDPASLLAVVFADDDAKLTAFGK
jgi:hypothetical protein